MFVHWTTYKVCIGTVILCAPNNSLPCAMYLEFKIIYGIQLNWADAHQKRKSTLKPTIIFCVINKPILKIRYSAYSLAFHIYPLSTDELSYNFRGNRNHEACISSTSSNHCIFISHHLHIHSLKCSSFFFRLIYLLITPICLSRISRYTYFLCFLYFHSFSLPLHFNIHVSSLFNYYLFEAL